MTKQEWREHCISNLGILDSVKMAELANEKPVTGTEPLITTLTATKPALVLKAEQLYVGLYRTFYGAESIGFTSAQKEQVSAEVADMCIANPQLMAATFPMWQAFDVIEHWWLSVGWQDSFHPYPWGAVTAERTVTIDLPVLGPSIAEENGWGYVTARDFE